MNFRAVLSGVFTVCLVLAGTTVMAQSDPAPSTIGNRTAPEAIPTEKVNTDNNGLTKPGRAAIYSAVIPGAGQFYNKHYWKIPIIYAVGAGIGTAIVINNRQYQAFKTSYQYATDNDNSTIPSEAGSANFLRLNRDAYRNNLHLSYIIAFVAYGMNIVEANVGAHLNEFDVSDDLSLRVQPTLQYASIGTAPVPGLSLNLHFKK